MVSAVSIGALALLTWAITVDGPVRALDSWVHVTTRAHTHSLANALQPIQILGRVEIVSLVVVVGAAVLARRRRSWRPVAAVGVSLIPAGLMVGTLKPLTGRTPPWSGVDDVLLDTGTAYPSGHTVLAALLLALGILGAHLWRDSQRWIRLRYIMLASLALGTCVGASMVVGRAHWVSDVVASLLLAVPLVIAAHAVLLGLRRRS